MSINHEANPDTNISGNRKSNGQLFSRLFKFCFATDLSIFPRLVQSWKSTPPSLALWFRQRGQGSAWPMCYHTPAAGRSWCNSAWQCTNWQTRKSLPSVTFPDCSPPAKGCCYRCCSKVQSECWWVSSCSDHSAGVQQTLWDLPRFPLSDLGRKPGPQISSVALETACRQSLSRGGKICFCWFQGSLCPWLEVESSACSRESPGRCSGDTRALFSSALHCSENI